MTDGVSNAFVEIRNGKLIGGQSADIQMMLDVAPVILCGGAGTRLWPLSRKSHPKQFLNLAGEHSLFQQAALRLDTKQPPIIVTASDYRFLVRQQLAEVEIGKAEVLIEPFGKNTAPAILAAAQHVVSNDLDGVALVMPSDHYIPDLEAFSDMVSSALANLKTNQIICFGVSPDRPETGYGYIQVSKEFGSIMPVKEFTEKPGVELARKYVEDGSYLWNAGIFLFRARDLLELANKIEPKMGRSVAFAYQKARKDLDFIRLDAEAWMEVPEASFDYAFMEKASQVGCISFSGKWSDLGDWEAVRREYATDDEGNVLRGQSHQYNCRNSTLWSTKDEKMLVGLGLDNVLAVSTVDSVLIADRSQAQNVRNLVQMLKKNGKSQVDEGDRDYRPWGWFERLSVSASYQVKILHVYPGESLSLQRHEHRSEHWVVINGQATVVQDERESILRANESVFIPVGQKHQLRNEMSDELEVIEVQTGSSFAEDDIIRLQDPYNRD